MKIRYIELREELREGGLEKAAADMAYFLNEAGTQVFRGDGAVDRFGPVDIVHFHGLWSPRHYSLAKWCRKQGIPTVVSPHGMLEPWAWKHRRWKKWPYFQLLEKRRLSWADALIATANPEANNIRKFFPKSRIKVLPLGIETDVSPDYEEARKNLGWGRDERVLLYLSRVHPKKGLKELLDSLLKISIEKPLNNLRLMILGDGPQDYVAQCQERVDQLRTKMTVDWLPPQWGTAKWKYLQGADLFCLPTYSENFGIVILEAGIVGTPVFTTTGTPWKEVEEAGFGWVIEPDPRIYHEVILSFLETPAEQLRTMRNNFSKWTYDHYGWPNLVESYARFYEKLIGASKRLPCPDREIN